MHRYPKGHPAEGVPRACFVTLTYSDANLPEDRSLRKRDWQLFVKRLRKARGQVRYLACGEYGEERLRPHYHACLFGEDFSDDRIVLEEEDDQVLSTSPVLERIWGHGFVTVAPLTFQSAAYVAKYTTKGLTGEAKEKARERVCAETGEVWRVEPEFAVASNRPGLGAKWFERYGSDCYPDDFLVVNGEKVGVPRYYDKLLARGMPEFSEMIRAKREEKAKKFAGAWTPERRAARSVITRNKLRKK